MALVAILVAKLLSPILVIIAGLGAFFARPWWLIALLILVAASLQEAVLHSTQYTRTFNPFAFGIGILAAGIWAAIGVAVRRLVKK